MAETINLSGTDVPVEPIEELLAKFEDTLQETRHNGEDYLICDDGYVDDDVVVSFPQGQHYWGSIRRIEQKVEEATADPRRERVAALAEEAEEAAKKVFGHTRVVESFIIGEEEHSVSEIDVGVVIGGNSNIANHNKTPIKLEGNMGQLDSVGNGVQYSPAFGPHYDADENGYENQPNINRPHFILYFGVDE